MMGYLCSEHTKGEILIYMCNLVAQILVYVLICKPKLWDHKLFVYANLHRILDCYGINSIPSNIRKSHELHSSTKELHIFPWPEVISFFYYQCSFTEYCYWSCCFHSCTLRVCMNDFDNLKIPSQCCQLQNYCTTSVFIFCSRPLVVA
jgi:hypothetical protein